MEWLLRFGSYSLLLEKEGKAPQDWRIHTAYILNSSVSLFFFPWALFESFCPSSICPRFAENNDSNSMNLFSNELRPRPVVASRNILSKLPGLLSRH